MDETSQIAIITAAASIGGGFVGQIVSIYYQSRMNQVERVRLIEARSSQLYLREIQAYDQIIPAMASMHYACREMALNPMLRQPYRDDKETRAAYRDIQARIKSAVSAHMQAAAANFHVIGLEAIETIDREARSLYKLMDELTAPATGGSPVTDERAAEIQNELEAMRQRMLRHCWESLDVTHLESSFRELREPAVREGTLAPSILGLNLSKPRESKDPWPEGEEMVE